ncbi:SDR family NAD(P)-dependent oxidoreductase [Marine Group I thaumarchaeote]|uniref:SDR family NAD(P)-dependent oxidoreductase n=1 Tax=Marine Group I thaumarchaeote TaxID=2511932 RepID=A0A7K4MYR7_9ARCH|nr:SDR family NAD(P)-dependent oxidoreductase [Marine Group I thaumarchaeote]
MLKFQNKTILVTGSGTGIGQAITKKFVENGASAIILGRRKEPLEETAEMLEEIIKDKQSNATVKIFAGVDVSDEKAVTGMFDALKSENVNLDVVVNNAGVSGPVTCFVHAPLDDFRSTVDIHLTGTFWTSVQALKVMKKGAKIITISTFFAEERPLEQRPYRFRSPYTASQGAKNRLVEAMSWELLEKGVMSIGTNPGPVHSDRIYKTVYPKAASEFLRVSGFEDLSPSEVEAANNEIVGLLGEDDETIKAGIKSAAEKLGKEETTLTNLLDKVKTIAEKIQKNTSTMIPDQQFLSQEQVATTVLTLADDEQAKILNGKIIPGDRVFYPVKPHIRSSVPKAEKNNLNGKRVLFGGMSPSEQSVSSWYSSITSMIEEKGGQLETSNDFDLAIHITGNLPDFSKLTELSRDEWDKLVDQFINTPAKWTQHALNDFVPGGSDDPRKFKDAKGRIVIIGPALPAGKKISGHERAKVEVFRGLLRPFVTTVNQELSDVLKSNVRVFLILPGTVDGKEPNDENIVNTINYLVSDEAASSSEVIFCPDETR